MKGAVGSRSAVGRRKIVGRFSARRADVTSGVWREEEKFSVFSWQSAVGRRKNAECRVKNEEGRRSSRPAEGKRGKSSVGGLRPAEGKWKGLLFFP
jgi:hypothetical protein